MQPSDLFKAFFQIIRFSFHMHDGKYHDQFIPVNFIHNRIRETILKNAFGLMKIGMSCIWEILLVSEQHLQILE